MLPTLNVSLGQYSDKGHKLLNQDCHGACIPRDILLDIKGITLAIADGISSSDVSQIASETAIKSLLEDYYCTPETWSVKHAIERVLTATNSWLHSQNQHSYYRYDKNKGYVCTLSALVIKGHNAHLFHAGDSRIYRYNVDGLEQLTHDHRLWINSQQSYLSRALGMEDICRFDYRTAPVSQNDIFILATDGIYEFISSEAMLAIINQHSDDLDRAAQNIAQHALKQGSDDNLTIQLVRIDQLSEYAAGHLKQQVNELPRPPLLNARMTFDGYTILRSLHHSNRSHLYLAQDNISKKTVVLKVPSTEMGANSHELESFLMEEWIARRINSAHVLKAGLPDRQRNAIYTVFEYIEGKTLAQWAIDNPKPDIETVRMIIEQIARGLQAFHRMEMLHQDIRPENIMIDQTGTVKLIDFGSTYIHGMEEFSNTRPLTYLRGTALYSAPEYFLGEPGTTRSEQFSLGIITCFLLSGRYPYGTAVAKAKTLSKQRNLSYQSVLDEEREIPIWIDDAIRKAVHPLPERRYEQISEYIHDLRQPGKAFLNKPHTPLIERNPVAVWQGVSLILLLVIIWILNF